MKSILQYFFFSVSFILKGKSSLSVALTSDTRTRTPETKLKLSNWIRTLADVQNDDCTSCKTQPSPSPPSILTPTLPTTPSDLAQIDDLVYNGSFRLPAGQYGDSSIDYAVGVIAYSSERNSIFFVGHDHQNAIAEFRVPSQLGFDASSSVADLPVADEPIQDFFNVFSSIDSNPEGINKITGMLEKDGKLIVNAENWYDAGGTSKDTTLVIDNASNLSGSNINGFFHLEGNPQCAGYMGKIPSRFQDDFGAKYYTGWSSVYWIVLVILILLMRR